MGTLCAEPSAKDSIVYRLTLPNRSATYHFKLLSFNNGHTDVARFSVDKETRTINLTCVRNCSSFDFRQFRHTLDSMSTSFQRLGIPLMKELGAKKD